MKMPGVTYLRDDGVRVFFPRPVNRKIRAKYSFGFSIRGGGYCRSWHDEKGRFWFKCLAEAGPLLRKLIDELERSIKQTSGPELNSIDARRFLFKYMRMTAAIEKELRRLPKSERRYVKTDADGLDMDSLWSIEEQCLREVIKEQTKRAQKDGITVTITNDMVKAKLEEKARQTK
jgi:hypothetical protein